MSVDKEPIFRKVTSVDVAKLAGVSRSAVSRTFTADASVSEKTREKVLNAAQELGYRVNKLASSLTSNRSDLVGIIASNMDNPFRSRQVEYLSRELLSKGLKPMLLLVEGAEDPSRIIGMLLEYNVSGVIVTSDTPPESICEECIGLGVPMVLVNKAESTANVDRVLLDNKKSGQLAAQALYDSGARSMAVVTTQYPSYSLKVRIKEFNAHCKKLGIESVEVFKGEIQNYHGGLNAAEQFLVKHGQLRKNQMYGVFCVSDYIALGFMDGIRISEQLKIPEQLKVISCDDIPQASWPIYELTTVRQDPEKLAKVVVEVLEERIRRPTHTAEVKILDVELIKRNSSLLTISH